MLCYEVPFPVATEAGGEPSWDGLHCLRIVREHQTATARKCPRARGLT
ncbi:hypothetical protein MTBUT4_80114 [Magnetospirillum sp. UT-4]|nr:hypothetical protein MTBUT4_80114 [Magnetospirillum sp. UT-4]